MHTFTPDEVIVAAHAAYDHWHKDEPHKVPDWRDLYAEERFFWIALMHNALDAITMQEAGDGTAAHPSNWHG